MADTLEPQQDPLDAPEKPMKAGPDTIATPEGDNEGQPDAPLTPGEPPIERPRGDEPHSSLPLRKA